MSGSEHIQTRLKATSPQLGQRCPVSGKILQAGDEVVICQQGSVTFSLEAWSEVVILVDNLCPFCRSPISAVIFLAPITPAAPIPSLTSKVLLFGIVVFLLIGFGLWIFITLSSPLAGWVNTTRFLFAGQMILLTIAVCLTPTIAHLVTQQRGRVARVIVETLLFVALLLGFGWWMFGFGAFGFWIAYAVVLILLLEVGSHLIEQYKIAILKRLSRNVSLKGLQNNAKAIERMFHRELILYISVPLGLIAGTTVGLVRGHTAQTVIVFCLQLVLLLASLVLFYFLVYAFVRMSDPLYKISQVSSPQIVDEQMSAHLGFFSKLSRILRFLVPSAKPETENQVQKDLDLAYMVSSLRKVYLYDAMHNVILLVAFMAVVVSLWGVAIDPKWLIGSLIGLALVFNQLPYVVGQSRLHEKVLEQYEGVEHGEVAAQLKKYSPLFPTFDHLTALFATGTAGGLVYFLLDQFVKNTLK